MYKHGAEQSFIQFNEHIVDYVTAKIDLPILYTI